ncbi:dipeptide ABC transporter ATP-binding protein [Nonomuraea typhae]|uniref:Dipeptide ABC transporter ATP-binding protein n=1 Tax=Nonomuraea typhae TaxID=2603600 RepID=A0ABW7Z6B4_9ACTN
MAEPLLAVAGLTVRWPAADGAVTACGDVSFTMDQDETLAVVGESGSGKSTLARALLGLLPAHAGVSGSIRFRGQELVGLSERRLRGIRGAGIALVPQNPLGSLNPVYPIGWQLAEALRAHRPLNARQARAVAADLLTGVGLGPVLRAYPHQLSGGMRQRVVIAMAMAARPGLIVADEPTSALDVTVRAQVLEALDAARRATGCAVLLITHDLGVVARHADRVMVMNGGARVELGTAEQVFGRPRMPYTRQLLDALPRGGARLAVPEGEPLLTASELVRHYRVKGGSLQAVRGVSLELRAGETLALAGESGSGKSTLGRMIVGLDRPTSGRLRVAGGVRVQLVMQDPTAALNPGMRVGALVGEPLRIHGGHSAGRVAELLERVSLPAALAGRYPGQLSGGQRQRVAIARALAAGPQVLVLDEPVSALDAVVQSGIVALLAELQRELGLAYLLIGHDLGLAVEIAHRTAIMYLGRVVEHGPTADVLGAPAHPYTRALVSAVPVPDPVKDRARPRVLLPGDPPAAMSPPEGCGFHPRCPIYAERLGRTERERCRTERPLARVACHYPSL